MVKREPASPRKLQGQIAGDAEARALLTRNGMNPDQPENQRFLRIARAYFGFDMTGDQMLRDQMLGQCLREMAKREKSAAAQDHGRIRQRRERRQAMIERPWLPDFVKFAQKLGSMSAAAEQVKKKYKLPQSVGAIRKQAYRIELPPLKSRNKK